MKLITPCTCTKKYVTGDFMKEIKELFHINLLAAKRELSFYQEGANLLVMVDNQFFFKNPFTCIKILFSPLPTVKNYVASSAYGGGKYGPENTLLPFG